MLRMCVKRPRREPRRALPCRPRQPGSCGPAGAGLVLCLTLGAAASAAFQQEAAPPHWIWHPAGRAPIRSRPRRATSARPSASRKTLAWPWTRRPTTPSRSTSTASSWPRGTTGARPSMSRPGWRSGRTSWRPRPRTRPPARRVCCSAAASCRWGRGCPSTPTRPGGRTDQVPAGDGWTQVDFDDTGWARAVDLGPLGIGALGSLVFADEDPSERSACRPASRSRPSRRPRSRARSSPSRSIPTAVPASRSSRGRSPG